MLTAMLDDADTISAGPQVMSRVEVRGTDYSLVHPRGAATLREGRVLVRVKTHRDRLFVVKRGEMPWPEADAWCQELHRDFDRAFAETKLPERPDYEAANCFLFEARRKTVPK